VEFSKPPVIDTIDATAAKASPSAWPLFW
jgi:hypothetical protein